MSNDSISKIRIYRNSGRPVNIDDEQAFLAEWRIFYDKACERAMLDMMRLQRYLSFGHFLLEKKWEKPVYLHNFDELKSLQVEVGHTISIGVKADDLSLIGIIQDFGGND